MKRQELISRIIIDLVRLPVGSTVEQLQEVMTRHLGDHLDSIENGISELIKDWESKMSDDDKTLYSLGLRRALDIVRGDSPTL